jgi:hypothetical protein
MSRKPTETDSLLPTSDKGSKELKKVVKKVEEEEDDDEDGVSEKKECVCACACACACMDVRE